VLGPAHLRWHDNSQAGNRARWSGWDWTARGDEWNVSPEWREALIKDVLKRWIPRGAVVLEIGPGAGRWSEPLASHASHLIVVDISDHALELCRGRLAGRTNVDYVLTPGSELLGVPSASVDAIWSFDVFVHIAPYDQASYLSEIERVLVPGGVAVIHHADGRNRGELPSRHGWRAPMSRKLFASLAAERRLVVERHLDAWGPDGRYDLSGYADAITVLKRPLSNPQHTA
jgi:SAM-dependent methyltransferase